ncbi:hypothetical protein P3T37_002095 [Kitasatospora sp. MAA4]|uniref:hypothetical protein n=1 Tax=Kitasatospora sp. MAA4 TaxID=3035093 RepID=UPI0024760244|nr:hypothetical protein [Kitasatospora sp. MAA4]MDH6132709.1 hypothetical protein [Kitasatospora sp. MAA4]
MSGNNGDIAGGSGIQSGDYFAELAGCLSAAGLSQEQVATTVADLRGYLAESESTDAYEEFGAPRTFAAGLVEGRVADEPDAQAETWKWATDIYADRQLLNRYGDQGWEVEGLDRLGRFVCRRDAQAAMRWEYRREIANNAKERESVAAGLALDAWEPCGHWLYFMYFKRPKAASAGPAAELDDLVAPPAKQLFLSGRYRGKLKQFAAAAVVSGTVSALVLSYGGDGVFLPFLIASVVAAPVGGYIGWSRMKREITAAEEA